VRHNMQQHLKRVTPCCYLPIRLAMTLSRTPHFRSRSQPNPSWKGISMFRKWHEGAIHEKPLLSVYKGAVPGVYRSRLALTAEDLGKCVSTFSALCGRSSSVLVTIQR
jgi:hypothetical protein